MGAEGVDISDYGSKRSIILPVGFNNLSISGLEVENPGLKRALGIAFTNGSHPQAGFIDDIFHLIVGIGFVGRNPGRWFRPLANTILPYASLACNRSVRRLPSGKIRRLVTDG